MKERICTVFITLILFAATAYGDVIPGQNYTCKIDKIEMGGSLNLGLYLTDMAGAFTTEYFNLYPPSGTATEVSDVKKLFATCVLTAFANGKKIIIWNGNEDGWKHSIRFLQMID